MGSEFSKAQGQAVSTVTVDYYAVLSRAIETSRANPGQLRRAIYDMARVNLHREILWQNPAISETELKVHLLALEDAIQRVEATHSEDYDNLVFRPDDPRHLIEALNEQPRIETPHVVEAQIEDVPVEPEPQPQFQPEPEPEPQFQPEPEPQPEPHPVPEPEPVAAPDPWAELISVLPQSARQPEFDPYVEPYVEPARARAIDLDAAQFEAVNERDLPAESRGELVILSPEPPMAMQSGPMLQAAPDIIVDYHPPSREFAYLPPPPPNRIWNGIGSFIQLTAAALLAVAIFAAMTGQLNLRWIGDKQQQAAVAPPASQAPAPAPVSTPPETAVPAGVAPATAAPPPFPLPATYGVYALNDDKLFELDRLTIRVPDARIPISTEIREPSRVALPDGKVSFVVFRRELANGAPEKVQVRVIAKVAREMTFTDGKAKTNTVDNLWRVRNNAFDFKVAPVNDNRELIVIRPETDFVLPAGRYALILNGLGYDFAVAGPITSPLQCLERIETTNGGMYSECRNPKLN